MSRQEDTKKKLERLLEKLFIQDDNDIVILGKPKPPYLYGNCCTESYGGYSYSA